MEIPQDKIIFSGIQPSGSLHIGNYLGAIKQWVLLQENNTAYYCIVDEHALTSPSYDPGQLPKYVLDATAMYLAAGLAPENSTIFMQSHVPSHTKLAWLLATQTPLGELNRMTQYKEKSEKQKDKSSLGLLSYPVLQAADILLYQANLVPVGEDQVQHIELTRDIAKRFNNKFGEDIFTIPKPLVNKDVARIMSLSDPKKKMSKSDQSKSYVALTDTEEDIRKKVASAVTETDPVISFKKSGPGVKNLLDILKAFRGESEESIESELESMGFKELKEKVADGIIESLKPLQERFEEIRSDEDKLNHILSEGAEQAAEVANETLQIVQTKMGLT